MAQQVIDRSVLNKSANAQMCASRKSALATCSDSLANPKAAKAQPLKSPQSLMAPQPLYNSGSLNTAAQRVVELMAENSRNFLEMAGQLAQDCASSRHLIQSYVNDRLDNEVDELGFGAPEQLAIRRSEIKKDIYQAIDDLNIRWSWTVNSPCLVKVQGGEWVDAHIIGMTRQQNDGGMYVTARCHHNDAPVSCLRFDKRIKPICLRDEDELTHRKRNRAMAEMVSKHNLTSSTMDFAYLSHAHDAEQQVRRPHLEAALNMIVYLSPSREATIVLLESLKKATLRVCEFHRDYNGGAVGVQNKLRGYKGGIEYLLLLLGHSCPVIRFEMSTWLRCLSHPPRALLRELVYLISQHLLVASDEDEDEEQKEKENVNTMNFASMKKKAIEKLATRANKKSLKGAALREFDDLKNQLSYIKRLQIHQSCRKVIGTLSSTCSQYCVL